MTSPRGGSSLGFQGGLEGTVLTVFNPGSLPGCAQQKVLPQPAETLGEQERERGPPSRSTTGAPQICKQGRAAVAFLAQYLLSSFSASQQLRPQSGVKTDQRCALPCARGLALPGSSLSREGKKGARQGSRCPSRRALEGTKRPCTAVLGTTVHARLETDVLCALGRTPAPPLPQALPGIPPGSLSAFGDSGSSVSWARQRAGLQTLLAQQAGWHPRGLPRLQITGPSRQAWPFISRFPPLMSRQLMGFPNMSFLPTSLRHQS